MLQGLRGIEFLAGASQVRAKSVEKHCAPTTNSDKQSVLVGVAFEPAEAVKNPLGPFFRGLWWLIVGVPQADLDYYGPGGPYLASKSKLPAAGWVWVVVNLIMVGALVARLMFAVLVGGK
jgi:hypothetical protein